MIVGLCTWMVIHVYEYSGIPEKESCYKRLVDIFNTNFNRDLRTRNIGSYKYECIRDGGRMYHVPVFQYRVETSINGGRTWS